MVPKNIKLDSMTSVLERCVSDVPYGKNNDGRNRVSAPWQATSLPVRRIERVISGCRMLCFTAH